MRIIIDADACPDIKNIEEIAIENNIELLIFVDINHLLTSDYAKILVVDYVSQNVDMHIINEVKTNDLVITNDYGLAAVCLGKKALVIGFSGFIYNSSNIDGLLALKHLKTNLRKRNIHMKNIKKRTKEDSNNLINTIINLINE